MRVASCELRDGHMDTCFFASLRDISGSAVQGRALLYAATTLSNGLSLIDFADKDG